MAHLRTDEQIRAAGAARVQGWELSDDQVERLAALLMPVRDKVTAASEKPVRGAA